MTASSAERRDRIAQPRLPAAQLISTALQAFRTRRMRATLSALGIAIGIGAMVAVVGVSASAQANLIAEIDALGTNLLTVTPGQTLVGANEVLPATSVPMIGHIKTCCQTPPSTRFRARASTATRSSPRPKPAGSASTPPATTCPR